MELQAKQKRQLKALAHSLKPTVIVGKQGVTDAIAKEIDRALFDHELIKIKLPAEGPIPDQASALSAACGAHLISTQGRIAILYKEHPEDPKIGMKSPRKAKRSH
jgi:RNA-binding protein